MTPTYREAIQYRHQKGKNPFVSTKDFTVNLDLGLTGTRLYFDGEKLLGMSVGDSLTIFAGYASDGCSPCIMIGGFRIGIPSPKSSATGFFVHDFMYQFGEVGPWDYREADSIFCRLLRSGKFFAPEIYHAAVSTYSGVFRNLFTSPAPSIRCVLAG